MMTGRSGWLSADPPQQLDAVGIGKPHVQHRDVGALLLELLHGLRAVGGEHQIVPWLERPLVAEPERGLVLDDQDAPAALCLGHATYPATRCRAAPWLNGMGASGVH